MFSVSTLSLYSYCARKLYLQHVLKIREPVKDVMVKGSVRHKIHENINNVDESLVTSITRGHGLNSINELYIDAYHKIVKRVIIQSKQQLDKFSITKEDMFSSVWPMISHESASRASLLYDFIQKHKVYGQELWEKLYPKIISELKVSSIALNLTGIVDQVEKYPEKIIPIEIKTGSAPASGIWPGHRIQLVSYAMLLESRFNTTISSGIVHYLDRKEKRNVLINPFMREEIKDLIKKITALIQCRKLPERVKNKNKCSSCGIRQKCYDDALMAAGMRRLLPNE